MEYRFIVQYVIDEQTESLEVISDSPKLTFTEASARVEAATLPYGKTDVRNIVIIPSNASENMDTDPATSTSE